MLKGIYRLGTLFQMKIKKRDAMKTDEEQIEKLKESLKMQAKVNDDLRCRMRYQRGEIIEKLRQHLFIKQTMSSEMELINRTERLVQKGYDNCIKELLMWLENIKENCDETYNNRKDS